MGSGKTAEVRGNGERNREPPHLLNNACLLDVGGDDGCGGPAVEPKCLGSGRRDGWEELRQRGVKVDRSAQCLKKKKCCTRAPTMAASYWCRSNCADGGVPARKREAAPQQYMLVSSVMAPSRLTHPCS